MNSIFQRLKYRLKTYFNFGLVQTFTCTSMWAHSHTHISIKTYEIKKYLTQLTDMDFSVYIFPVVCYLHVSSVGRVPATDPVVSWAGWFPGPLLSRAVVVEASSTRIFVRFPVAQDVQRGGRGNRWERWLRDLQLLEVCVHGGLGSTLSGGRYTLWTKQRKSSKSEENCPFSK